MNLILLTATRWLNNMLTTECCMLLAAGKI
jgi:hypothetical protein